MKGLLFAVLVTLIPALAGAQTLADEAAARLKDPAVVARFNNSYADRYYKNPKSVLNELAGSSDPDASAMLALIMTGNPEDYNRGDAVSALGKRLKDPARDLSALKFLALGVRNSNPYIRTSALYALSGLLSSPSMKGYSQETVQSVIMPALSEAVKTSSSDPDRDVQSAYGSLLRDLASWNTFDSPNALKGKEEIETKEKRLSYIGVGVLALMPIIVIVAFVMLLMSGGGVLEALVRPSAALSGVTVKCVQALKQDPALLLVPLACALVLTALTGGVAYSSLHASGLRSNMSRGEVEARAFEMMLRPQMIAAYLAAGFALFFLNAALMQALIRKVRGEEFSLTGGLVAALLRLPQILALSFLAYGIVYVARFLAEKLKLNLGAWHSYLVEMSMLFFESGVMLAASYVMAVMFADGVGLAEALKRLPQLSREGRGPALRSLFSMATVRLDGVMGAVFLPFLFCVTLIPISAALGGDNSAWLSSMVGLGAYDDYAVLFVGGVAGAVLMGSFFLALAQVLNSVLAVGVYFHDKGETLPGGFKADDFHTLKAPAAPGFPAIS